jgi:transcriptional antiterminator RfaH
MSHERPGGSGRAQEPKPDSALAWFCLHSQPKREHIAAGHLRKMGIEVLNPRIRFERLTKFGALPVTEALFPSYLFARFDLKTSLSRVNYAPGVKHVVHFGSRWPMVPDEVIDEIRVRLGPEEVHVVPSELSPGDKVNLAGGAWHGLEAVITRVLPGKKRVLVLMDFLGRQTTVELDAKRVVKPGLGS